MKQLWSESEIEELREKYSFTEKTILIEIFSRKWEAIEQKALSLGLRRKINVKEKWSESEILLLKTQYEHNVKSYILALLSNRTWKSIREKAISLNLKRDQSLINKEIVSSSKKSNLEKYGVEYNWQRPEIKMEIKKKNLDRYGVPYPQMSLEIQKKTKKNNFEKYGHENTLHTEEGRRKRLATWQKRWGADNPMKNQEVREKGIKTNLEKRGVPNTFQCPLVKEKIKENLSCPEKKAKIISKRSSTNIDKYGHKVASKNQKVKDKARATNFRKYKVSHPMQTPEGKQRVISVMQEKYNVDNAMFVPEIRSKVVKTTQDHFGVSTVLSLPAFRNREKAIETMKKNKSFSKSKPEICFLSYLRSFVDSEILHQVKHPVLGYVLDFYSPKYDLWMQFDGVYWHGKNLKDKECLRNDPRFKFKKSHAYGIYKNMRNDEIQNKNIPNLIRFWEDAFVKAFKLKEVEKYIEGVFKEKGILLGKVNEKNVSSI